MSDHHQNLKRSSDEHYQGQAYVHWMFAIEERKTGWLIPIFYCKFRELLTHTLFRYSITCPIFCCMPDHIHLLLIGIADDSDQRVAVKYLRTNLNLALEKLSCRLQRQPYDHVLKEDEVERAAFESTAEYIARNPERKNLVGVDRYQEYKFTSCLVPGCPDLTPWQPDYWDRFWRIYSHQRKNGLQRHPK